jgi:hypothetical protein
MIGTRVSVGMGPPALAAGDDHRRCGEAGRLYRGRTVHGEQCADGGGRHQAHRFAAPGAGAARRSAGWRARPLQPAAAWQFQRRHAAAVRRRGIRAAAGRFRRHYRRDTPPPRSTRSPLPPPPAPWSTSAAGRRKRPRWPRRPSSASIRRAGAWSSTSTSARARAATPRLRNGDILRIPAVRSTLNDSIVVTGHVFQPGARQYRGGLRLTQVLGSVEDLKPGADLDYVLVRRELLPRPAHRAALDQPGAGAAQAGRA